MRVALVVLAAMLVGCSSENTIDTRPEVAALGKVLYQRYGCAVCHGMEGRGDGPVAQSMDPKPRDFRDVQAFKKGRSLDAISEIIRAGVVDQGVGMPGYPHVPDGERRAIGVYVASLHDSD
ncbi:MAG: cytochrome c [Candidatus Latescibacterota bacterium]|nr:cytochrome c [Candidatus Latescibacterota bacterium]